MHHFNIRVYGLLVNDKGHILLSDEKIRGRYYTKFPGGGLEFGEGLIDCLKREFHEETGIEIRIVEHFYTTDYFQPSAFSSNEQIISVYYFVERVGGAEILPNFTRNNFSEAQLASDSNCESLRWIALTDLTENEMSLPIDKKVAFLLRQISR